MGKPYYVRAVREAGGLGDAVRCLAVLQGLRQKYPDARVHFFGAKYLQNLIAPRSTAFDLFIPCDHNTRPREAPLSEHLYKHLHRGIIYYDSVDMWCWAYLHEPDTKGVCCQDRIELWCEHASVEPSRPKLNLLPQDISWRNRYQKQYKHIIGIQPGATCRSREWPYKHWNTLCKMFRSKGFHIILFDVCARWHEEIEAGEIELSMSRPWPETLGKLAACDLVITPDSGFYHLAGAIRKKTLGIFGCTSGQIISRPWNWEIPTHHYIQLRHREIDYEQLPRSNSCGEPCKPICYMRWERGWDSDRYRKQGKYCSLMEQIQPELVFDKAMEIINKSF